jgi:uncharacterized protein DUF3551
MYRSSLRAAATTALALACLSLVFAHEAQATARRPIAAIAAAPVRSASYPWCLQYDSATQCSFRDRNQCEATASGAGGECVYISPGEQPGN